MSDNEKTVHYNRHAARFISMLALYACAINKPESNDLFKTAQILKDSYLNKDIFDLELTPEELSNIELYSPDEAFLEKLLLLVRNNEEEIINLIKSSLIEKWNFDKLDQALRAILILASAELLFHGETATNIIIDEYVTLTKCFYDNTETGFVNKIIDAMANKARIS